MGSGRRNTYRESRGNGTLVVLLDSRRPEALHLPDSLLAALTHFGIPYRLHDLARGSLAADALLPHRAVVIAQEHLGDAVGAADLRALLQAVQAGLGLINFDHDLRRYGTAYREALGLVPHGVEAVSRVTTVSTAHFLTWTREPGAGVTFQRPAPMTTIRPVGTGDAAGLLVADEAPVLVTRQIGRGRVVQWLLSPKVWLNDVLGHARGLDDVFWKGIVWAARKPFVMKAMPPFVRLRLDDCKGHWQDARDLVFVDVLNAAGHVPNLGVCMRAVQSSGAQRLKHLFDAGRADISPHSLQPDVSLFYGDDEGEYSTARLAELMREMDDRLHTWGIRPSRVLSDHNHEWSERAIPFLLERGITFKMNVTCPGETWAGVHVDWQPAPYGQIDYVFDTIPGHPEFFVAFNHFPTLAAARTTLPGGRFLFDRDGGFGESKWDFLNGLTRSTLGRNDLPAMARRYATHMRLGLDSLFFGGAITHSHFLRDLAPAELEEVLRQAETLMPRHPKTYVSYDHIAEYARSKVETHLAAVEVDAHGHVRVTLVGRATVPLQLYVFRDVDDGVEHRFEWIEAGDAPRHVAFSG
jgi:hypothetical protein